MVRDCRYSFLLGILVILPNLFLHIGHEFSLYIFDTSLHFLMHFRQNTCVQQLIFPWISMPSRQIPQSSALSLNLVFIIIYWNILKTFNNVLNILVVKSLKNDKRSKLYGIKLIYNYLFLYCRFFNKYFNTN